MAIGLLLAFFSACGMPRPAVLRLATTTSTYDSGLLQELLPLFEAQRQVRVELLAVGTGQAIALGQRGDVDVILVHDLARELAFLEAGHGLERQAVMYNDFVLLGSVGQELIRPGTRSAVEALKVIAAAGGEFASRGDDSGTHSRELALWAQAGISPDRSLAWYLSLGQGMGATLQFANERLAYTLADRGTYLALRDHLPNLEIVIGGETMADNPDPLMRNPYGVIVVNPAAHPGVASDLGLEFASWLTSLAVQERIAAFGVDRWGEPLFVPDSAVWQAAHP